MPKVYVLFRFDVEDYITPQSDEALKGLVQIFDEVGVKAIFKLVGEKLRVLEERGRKDIIDKLAYHDIGYHTDWHSVHPTVSEYLELLQWEDGVIEFKRREGKGFHHLKSRFGTVSCYGQPGGAWAPQVYQALSEWDVPVYLDEGNHVGLEEKPFWYCNVLNIFKLRSNCTRINFRAGEPGPIKAKEDFFRIVERLKPSGGFVSIFYHPTEFATHNFWDAVNFSRGNNTPREEWRMPDLMTQTEMEDALRLFSKYLKFIVSQPDVEVITALQAADLLSDRSRGETLSVTELGKLAGSIGTEITYQRLGDIILSPAEIFSLIVLALESYLQSGTLSMSFPPLPLIGPTRRSVTSYQEQTLSWEVFKETIIDVSDFLRTHRRIPNEIWVGSCTLSPVDYLITAAGVLKKMVEGNVKVEPVSVFRGSLALEKQVPEESWGWIIFPENFRAPNLIELGKLQTWTLKPAQMCLKSR